MGGVAIIVKIIFFRFLWKSQVAIIDEQFIAALLSFQVTRFAYIDIEVTIAIDIGHCNPGWPYIPGSKTGFFGNILKLEIAFVEIKSIGGLAAAKKDIGQSVVIDIADGHAAAVVEITEGIGINFFGITEIIGEMDTRPFCGKGCK